MDGKEESWVLTGSDRWRGRVRDLHIALLTGATFGSAVGVGLIFLVGTAAFTFIIILAVQFTRRDKPAV